MLQVSGNRFAPHSNRDGNHSREKRGHVLMSPFGTILPEENPHRRPIMQSSSASAYVSQPEAQNKPRLTSFDSGQECSLDHRLEVIRIVEKAEEEDDLYGYVFDDQLLLGAY